MRKLLTAIVASAFLAGCNATRQRGWAIEKELKVNTSIPHYKAYLSREEGESQLVDLAAKSRVEEAWVFIRPPDQWIEIGMDEKENYITVPVIFSDNQYHIHEMNKELSYVSGIRALCPDLQARFEFFRRCAVAKMLAQCFPNNGDHVASIREGVKQRAVSPFCIMEYWPVAQQVPFPELELVFNQTINPGVFYNLLYEKKLCPEDALEYATDVFNASQPWMKFRCRTLPECKKHFEAIR